MVPCSVAKLLGVLDLPSKLSVELWYDEDANANEKSFSTGSVRCCPRARCW